MSKPTRLPEPAPASPAGSPAVLMFLRLALALLYPLLAYVASSRADGAWAAVAMADLVLLLLLEPLLQRRFRALLLLAACLLGLWWLSLSRHALLPLLAPPVVFLGLVGWWFARSLLPGRMPLISRIVEALYAQAGRPMTPELWSYTRSLTAVWAGTLLLLAALNLVLALCVVPDGILAHFGQRPPLAVPHSQWSWVANVLNYGIIGALFMVEYLLRKRLFPQRPYRNVLEFVQQMARLGPQFWARLMR